jgi:methionine salvage enolase-phosphatase E1
MAFTGKEVAEPTCASNVGLTFIYATPGSTDKQLLIFEQGKAHDVTEFFSWYETAHVCAESGWTDITVAS